MIDEKSILSIVLISRLTSMDLRKSMDGWYLPVVTNWGLREWLNSWTFYISTTQEGARHKSLITGLQRQRSTTKPNSDRVLESTNRSEREPLTGHRKKSKKKPRLPMIIVTLGRNVHRPITITTTTHSKTSIVTK